MIKNIIGISALIIFGITSGLGAVIMLVAFCWVAYSAGRHYGF